MDISRAAVLRPRLLAFLLPDSGHWRPAVMRKGMGTHLVNAPLKFAPPSGVAFFEALGWRASRKCDALAFKLSGGGGASGQVAGGVVRAHGLGAGIDIAAYPNVIGNLKASGELMRGAVRKTSTHLPLIRSPFVAQMPFPSLSLVRGSPASGFACCMVPSPLKTYMW